MGHIRRFTLLGFTALLCGAPSRAYDNISLAGETSFKKIVSRPGGAAALGQERLVSDAAAGAIQVFGSDGKPKRVIGVKGKGADQLGEPRGLALDEDGNVYVADAARDRVAVFSSAGKFLRGLGAKGPGAGQLSGPSGVAVTHDGVVYVADTGNNRVQVFSRDGIFLLGFGSAGEAPGQLKGPSALAVSPAGRVYVMDQRRVQVFRTDGVFLYVLDRPKADVKDKEPPAPVGLAADASGALFVAGSQQKIEEYGPDDQYIASFGTYGTGAGQFKEMTALAVAPDGSVLALDDGLDRLQGFKVTAAGRSPLAAAPTLRFSVKAMESRALVADDIAFAGDVLAGVVTKGNRFFLAGKRGAEAPKADAPGPKGKGPAKGKGIDQFNGPAAVFGAPDRVWVSDAGNARVVARTLSGTSLGSNAVGSAGKRDGQFKAPAGLAADAQGRLTVADPDLQRVQVFSPDGIFLRALSGPFGSPVDVAALPDKTAVLDAGRKAVLYFDDRGRAVGKPAEGLLSPVSIAADPRGKLSFVYVLDAGDGQVKVMSGEKTTARFGSPSLFTAPKALAVDDRGVLWVADAAGIKSFEIRLSPLAPADFSAAPGEGEVVLAWKPDPENMAAGFRLYRSSQSSIGETAPYRVFAATETSFRDQEIVPGLTYHYALAAVALDGDGKNPVEGARAAARATTVRPANLPPVDFASLELQKIFSAQYKFYEKNPVGRVTIKNNTEKTFQKIRVGFIFQNYMDFVTEKVIDRFEPGSLETVELKATFNNKILSVTEDTPVQAQLTLTYYDDGQEKVFKRTEPVTVYSRNAMSWDDPRRLATFITAKDPALLEFARAAVRDFHKEMEAVPVNPALAKAAVVFEAAGALGLSYLKDPNNPFDKVSENAKAIDYVQYPRETLRRKTGDCDDLVAMTAALLESVSVPTAVVDVPGHVLLAFQLDDSFPLDAGAPEGWVFERDGALWAPLETTFVGRSFVDAWEQGAKVVRNTAPDRLVLVEAAEAWQAYAPATLTEEAGTETPKKADIIAKFPSGGLNALAAKRLEALTARYEARLKENPKDADARLQLGVTRAEHGVLDKSADDFDALIAAEPKNASALNNRGNVHWLKGEAAKARDFYAKAAAADGKDAGIQLNLARAEAKAGNKAAAKKAFDQAAALDPKIKKDFSTPEDLLK